MLRQTNTSLPAQQESNRALTALIETSGSSGAVGPLCRGLILIRSPFPSQQRSIQPHLKLVANRTWTLTRQHRLPPLHSDSRSSDSPGRETKDDGNSYSEAHLKSVGRGTERA